MSKLEIIRIPNPVLKKVSSPIKEITPEISKLIADMLDTMHSFKSCIGLAAPQVNKSLRLLVIDVSLYHKPHPNHGQLIMINPGICKREGNRFGREGCLSVPDLTGNVIRAEKILVEAINQEGKPIKIESTGFESVVIQHEIDHLDGLLFLDRVSSLKTDVFRRKTYLDKPSKKG